MRGSIVALARVTLPVTYGNMPHYHIQQVFAIDPSLEIWMAAPLVKRPALVVSAVQT
jgi:hypothetical protein